LPSSMTFFLAFSKCGQVALIPNKVAGCEIVVNKPVGLRGLFLCYVEKMVLDRHLVQVNLI